MGNICRSPSAEAIMSKLIVERNLNHLIEVDSAGTIDYHEGEPADRRMIAHAEKRGYNITSTARRFNREVDFERFDYIVTMDNENYENILSQDFYNQYDTKIYKMVDFSKKYNLPEVPDPYDGNSTGFEKVLDILEDSVEGLLEKVQNDFK